MFGSATALFNRTLGGVTMVCERLSASAGTEMMGWRENAGSAFLRTLGRRAPRVERRQVFRSLVVDNLRAIELRHGHDPRLQRKKAGHANQQNTSHHVVSDRPEKAAPGQRALHEYIRPECGWGRAQFERRVTARKYHVPQVPQEHAMPRRQLDQEPWNGRGRRILNRWQDRRHLSIVDANWRIGIPVRA